jgi:hypothetical protein
MGCLLAGCAVNTGVVNMGQGTYMIERQAATGFPGLGNLKAEAIAEAGAFCAQQGGNFAVVQTTETQPPYVMGNYPRVSVTFTC